MMTRCAVCGTEARKISATLRVCANCIKSNFDAARPHIFSAHEKVRAAFDMSTLIPKTGNVSCRWCANECCIPEGEKGYCGLRENRNGKLVNLGGTADRGIVECYYDLLPTNCVADRYCAAHGLGYPKFSYSRTIEHGYKNLAVFYGACTFNCLFCQNWHYRYLVNSLSPVMSADELAHWVDEKTACICYFGGDPSPQMVHALKTSELAIENARRKKRILRICWESNGSMNPTMLTKAAELSLNSGGCIKFDLKTFDEKLNLALCGVSNKRTIENFKFLAENYCPQRAEPPFLIASTLLVPGYVEKTEVEQIARLIADLDNTIPYVLLAFHPQFYMADLPVTSRKTAMECFETAKGAGLKNVRLGNVHLLS